jgi:exodeoxyribonuclease V alpha subunit
VSDAVLHARDVERAVRADGLLAAFNEAGVLAAADVHVALRLARLGEEQADDVLLAVALAVRAPRLASVCVDLATVRDTAAADLEASVDLQALPWPALEGWLEALAASPLVAVGERAPDERTLRLVGTTLYLDRYWREERQVAADLLTRAPALAGGVDETTLAAGLDALLGAGADDLQREASAVAVRRLLAVIAGGPGTGKTTTVTRIVALLDQQARASGKPLPLVALAAPTGKAAARLQEAVHEAARSLPPDLVAPERMLGLRASTIHRLLGARPDSDSRFRHDRSSRLPHDVVMVDETSMVSLSLMARLLEAVRDGARLVLVGDPQQLASVEAGAVLGDVVGAPALDDSTVVLRTGHRFAGGIAELADAVRSGDAAGALGALASGRDGIRWIDADVAGAEASPELAPVRELAVDAGRAVTAAAASGDGAAALAALGSFRLLCAHRRGPYGVATWNAAVARWLGADGAGGEPWYPGRPLLVTQNDHSLRLYNGDSGVVVARGDGGVAAVFERDGGLYAVSPARLGGAQTVYAMTIHRSQGSQFDAVAVLLPDAASRILTRELLYTAVTRARHAVLVCGTEATITAALRRPAARASGLRRALRRGPG